MADTLPTGASAQPPLYRTRTPRPLTWIKRRARRLQRAYAVDRREAVAAARIDWAHFQPAFAQ